MGTSCLLKCSLNMDQSSRVYIKSILQGKAEGGTVGETVPSINIYIYIFVLINKLSWQ